MEKVLRLSLLMSGIGASLGEVAWMILLVQPKLLVLTVPMAFLLSVLLTYGRLGFDNELTVLRASGMRFGEIFRPVFLMAGALFLLSVAVSFHLLPRAERALRTEMNRLFREKAPISIEPGIFFTSFRDIVLLVNEKTDTGAFKGIFIYDSRRSGSERVITAREGRLSVGEEMLPGLSLKDGTVHLVDGDDSTVIRFSEYRFSMTLAGRPPQRKKGEMTPIELYRNSLSDSKRKTEFLIEFHRRLTFPALLISLAFLAPTLSLRAGRTGRIGGFVIGLLVFTLYYAALISIENLVRTERLHHSACWTPFIVLTVLGVFLYRRADG